MKTKEDFWELVEIVDWKSDNDYNRIKKYLLKNYTKSEIREYNDIYLSSLDYLYIRFENDWLGEPGISVSDDGWWDLRADVIGRGKEFYYTITAEKLMKMANKHDFDENFGYSFNIDI